MISTLQEFKIQSLRTLEHLNQEFSKIRAGRPSVDILEDVLVEAYGSNMPINQVASVSVVDSNMILVSPWDKTLLESIQKAIQKSSLGINPVVDGETIRLVFPALTEEKRKEFVKICSSKAEEAKIGIRQHRKEYLQYLDNQKKESLITEDFQKTEEEKLQSSVEDHNYQIDQLLKAKEEKLLKI
ncbi:MAG: ribosome recycling factor [bacterium]